MGMAKSPDMKTRRIHGGYALITEKWIHEIKSQNGFVNGFSQSFSTEKDKAAPHH
jgi:hypothetical protein